MTGPMVVVRLVPRESSHCFCSQRPQRAMTGQWKGGTVAHRDTDAQTDVLHSGQPKRSRLCVSSEGGRVAHEEGRVVPLLASGDKRGRRKALTFAVLVGTSTTDSEPVNFSGDLENWSYIRSTSKTPLKRFISSHVRLCARASVAPLRGWFLARAVRDPCDTEHTC